ncbi:MAG: (d)CMP kinase [Lewinellaceae bacterium]|nr:(d)CMP kinase [Lewinellaceae bacterium]
MKPIKIAIDGYSSCGKSTLAKALAQSLGYLYVDSGAMYRAFTLFFLENGIDYTQPAAAQKAVAAVKIDFHLDPLAGNRTLLNGRDVEDRIREMDVSQHVSPVATLPLVRRALVQQQQELGRNRGIAMDGRDIGTVVFPQAEMKIFLVAEREERIRRRQEQLHQWGEVVSVENIRRNLFERDYIDSTRSDSPLMQAKDAVRLDNTNLSEDEQLAICLTLAELRIAAANA